MKAGPPDANFGLGTVMKATLYPFQHHTILSINNVEAFGVGIDKNPSRRQPV